MEKMIVDIAIILAGLYVTYLGATMLATKKINQAMLPEEELKKCKKAKELARYWGQGMLPIGIVAIILGVFGLVLNLVIKLESPYGNYGILAFFLLLIVAFMLIVKQGKTRFM